MLKKYGAQSVYGEDIPIAIIAIENKVFAIVVSVAVGIILGCQPIVSYNLGCGNYARVKRLFLFILACIGVIGAVATILFQACPSAIIGLFGAPSDSQNINPQLYTQFGVKTFRIFLMLIGFTCFIKFASIFFQAVGKPVIATVASLIRDIVCFVPLACVLPLSMGIDGVLWAAPVADAVAVIVTVALIIICFKSLNAMERKEKAQSDVE